MSVIPQLDHRLGQVMLVGQRTQARGAQQGGNLPAGGSKPQPAGGKHPQEMHPLVKSSTCAAAARSPRFNTLSARAATWVWRFTAWASVAEKLPLRPALGMDLRRAATLILAVVPPEGSHRPPGHGPEACQFTRSAAARCKGLVNTFPNSSPISRSLERTGVPLAALGQWQIGKPRVLPLKGSTPSRRVLRGRWRAAPHP